MGRRKRRRSPLKQKFAKRMRIKLVKVFGVVLLAFLVLVIRIVQINVTEGDRYSKIVLDQQVYNSRTIPFKRGDILDTNGTKLATSERVYNVILDVKTLLSNEKKRDAQVAETKAALRKHLKIDEEIVEKAIEERPDSYYVVLKKGVSYKRVQNFKKATEKNENVQGVWMEEDYVRTYPYKTLACDVIGFSVSGNVGATGLEASYNNILNGTDGRSYGYQNSDSVVEQTVKEAVNGSSIVTTIDANIQSIVEKHLRKFDKTYTNNATKGAGFKNGAVIVMNPNNGEILAMASSPTYDLNNPRDLSQFYSDSQLKKMSSDKKLKALNDLWRNFCVSDTFEPGSTIKPFTMAAAFEIGKLNGNETYYCDGSLQVADYDIKCISYDKGGHGTQTLTQVLENSCNVGLMQIAKSMGVEEFTKYQHVFGFGEYSGIDLPGDASTAGLLYTTETMGEVDLATNSFGQNFNVSMTQLASGFCSLINGGEYYKPHLLKAIQDADGDVVETLEPVLMKRTISEETSERIKKAMYSVVENGGGSGAQVEGYAVGGKTGTAEKLPRSAGKNLVSFIGYAPQDTPQVVVYVVIDEPNIPQQGAGSPLITKLASDIMTEIFPYMNIEKIKD